MSQAQSERESQRLRGLASSTSAFLLLSAWSNVIALGAILVACVSMSVTPAWAKSDAVACLSAELTEHGAGIKSDATDVRSAPSPWKADQRGLESECDDLDSDSETTAEGAHSLELSAERSLREKAPNPGRLFPAAHLRVSDRFARGPPSVG